MVNNLNAFSDNASTAAHLRDSTNSDELMSKIPVSEGEE